MASCHLNFLALFLISLIRVKTVNLQEIGADLGMRLN